MGSAIEMTGAHGNLMRVIRRVRNRWRLKVALRGLAIVLGVGAMVLLVSAYGMEQFKFSDASVTVFRLLTYLVLVALIARFLVWPLTRSVPDERVALYLEENEPSLEATVLSAVEYGAASGSSDNRSPRLVQRLIENALERVARVRDGAAIERRRMRVSSGAIGGILIAALLLMGLGPAFLRNAARLILVPWRTAEAAMPYSISVTPGNVTVAKGGAQEITARLNGFTSEAIELAVRRGASGEWEHLVMTPGAEAGSYAMRLFDLAERTEYYVEANGVRSGVFRIDVANLPYVERIDLEYRYPSYTGLPAEKVENTGDIAAPAGTSVVVTAKPTMPVRGGRIVLEKRDTIALTLNADGSLGGTIRVTKDGFYKIELQTQDGVMASGSLDYTIDVLPDNLPSVAFLKPGRDTKVTAVEEVFAEVEATDDYGVGKVDLVYSVNGGPEQKVSLHEPGGRRMREVVAGHTFFVEELNLTPGDFISYYAQATDNSQAGGARVAKTDIYFLQVRPFQQNYRQAQQAGGGGGGGEESPAELSQRQREIIAATFKVERDRATIGAPELRENFTTIHLSQGRLREQVETLARRMRERGIMGVDSTFAKIAEELPKAAAAMAEAEAQLLKRSGKDALPPEQRALQSLQRAEALFRDVQVSMGGQGGGGGGGEQPNAEDLADLFELETDKLRNQYETVDRGRQQQADNAVDETLERLRQLASRQQQENERARSMAERLRSQQQSSSGGGGGGQRQLADETEELARRLERLAREQPNNSELRETARRLQEAANAMRRSATGANDGGVAQGAAALDRLQEARRLLDENRRGRTERDANNALRRAEELAARQKEIASDVEKLGAAGAGREAEQQRLMERKDTLASGVTELERDLDRMARESRREQPAASKKMTDAANSIRDNRLPDKIRYSKGVMRSGSPEYARGFEGQIGENLEELRSRVAEAAGAISDPAQSRATRSLDRARELVRGLESLEERMRQRRLEGQSGEQQGDQAGAQQQGRQGQGQQGQQAGQQGQEGQQGAQGARGQSGQQGQQGQGQQGQGQQGQGQQGQGQQGQGQGQSEQGGGGRGGQNQQPATNRLQGGGFANPGGGVGMPPGGQTSTGPGSFSPEDIRQFAREYRDRRQSAEALRRELLAQGVDVADLDRMIARIRELESQRVYSDQEEIERLQSAVIEGLKAFEFALRRELDDGARGQPLLGGNGDVPAGFRQMVEEYYRSLAKKQR